VPDQTPHHFTGIDPGFQGGVCVMDRDGAAIRCWAMPTHTPNTDIVEVDLAALWAIFRTLRRLPGNRVGIEWPQTRPGEGAERSERFGRGKGYLEAFAHAAGLDYQRVAPNKWKGRLGLPGKTDPEAVKRAYDMLCLHYPNASDLVTGPRGGIRDGLVDAAMIAHFLRVQSVGGLRSVVAQHGKDSPQALSLIFRSGRPRRRKSGGAI
jgi:hypothetical protein